MEILTDISPVLSNLRINTCRVKVNRAEMLKYLGYSGQDINDDMQRRIDNLATAAESDLTAKYVWKTFPINFTEGEGGIVLGTRDIVLTGKSIARHLAGACGVCALALTLGFASERKIAQLNAVNAADALIYGAAASSMAESSADVANAEIAQAAAELGLHTGLRFSPGYGDLPLDVQPQIARALNLSKTLGVNVTKDNLLIPAKSITAFIGIFNRPNHTKYEMTCEGCPAQANCRFIKSGAHCYD